jgi:hypothetical protein
MRYETFTIIDPINGEQEFVTIYLDENNANTFPAQSDNLDYQAYLLWLAEQES